MADDLLHPARRFLHLCYCTDDGGAVVDLMVDGLGLRKTMETPMEPNSGSLFNMEGDITTAAAFVYDARGPRRAPAIEVQTWRVPAPVGAPPTDVTRAGIQALGYAVPDADATVERLLALGCTEQDRGEGPAGERTVVLRDPNGVTLDIVADEQVADVSNLHHVRITCTDLDASISWYDNLGWKAIERGSLADPALYGHPGGDAEFARLRLPDEPTETYLVQWTEPASHGRHPAEAYHAGIFRIALGVDDTRASHDALVASGLRFDRAPLLIELKGTPVPDMWICFLSDPDGVPYEFVQRPRDAFR
jgi:catechol 2,3-dioxygenase-like lactoylglutathione lyase family enzyme